MMILLQIYFTIALSDMSKFEAMYESAYVPALRKQEGYRQSRLLRIFEQTVANEIQAAATDFNYQMELVFSSEESRRTWVKSPEHQEVWPLAEALASRVEWRGYDLLHDDKL